MSNTIPLGGSRTMDVGSPNICTRSRADLPRTISIACAAFHSATAWFERCTETATGIATTATTPTTRTTSLTGTRGITAILRRHVGHAIACRSSPDQTAPAGAPAPPLSPVLRGEGRGGGSAERQRDEGRDHVSFHPSSFCLAFILSPGPPHPNPPP